MTHTQKEFVDEIRLFLVNELAGLILRLVPDNNEGNLWVIGIAEICNRAVEMRKK